MGALTSGGSSRCQLLTAPRRSPAIELLPSTSSCEHSDRAGDESSRSHAHASACHAVAWRRLVLDSSSRFGRLALSIAIAPPRCTPGASRSRLSAATGADVRIGWISWNPLRGRVGLASARDGTATPSEPAVVTAQDARPWTSALRRWLARRARARRASCCSGRGSRSGAPDPATSTWRPSSRPRRQGTEPPRRMPALDGRWDRRRRFASALLRIVSGSVEFRDETIAPALETSLHLDDASAHDLVLANRRQRRRSRSTSRAASRTSR